MSLFKLFITCCITVASLTGQAFAVKFSVVAPEDALTNRQPITALVYIDTEGKTLSGISGKFSFKEDLFIVRSISVESSAVSLWVEQPTVSKEKTYDGNTSISFEGIFPGGFDGVRSPYYKGVKPGLLFTVTLVPRNKGKGVFMVHDVDVRQYDPQASRIATPSYIKAVSVPELLPEGKETSEVFLKKIESDTLTATVTRSDLVANNKWFVSFNEYAPKSSYKEVYVAESNSYNYESISPYFWREARNPHILAYQNRSMYVHLKIVYSNNTYTVITIPPVENSSATTSLSRILISVVALSLLLYFYVYRNKEYFKKR